jgi:hypothetical protein
MNGNRVSWSLNSDITVELKIEVDRLWRRYDIDDRSGSAQRFERHERIAMAW